MRGSLTSDIETWKMVFGRFDRLAAYIIATAVVAIGLYFIVGAAGSLFEVFNQRYTVHENSLTGEVYVQLHWQKDHKAHRFNSAWKGKHRIIIMGQLKTLALGYEVRCG